MNIFLRILIFVFIIGNTHSIDGQTLISATLKGSRTKQQITNLFALPIIKNGAKFYKVLYTSVDAKGDLDTLSGLLAVPDDLTLKYPKLFYQHGTSDCKSCVPSSFGSNGGEEGQLGLLFAGLGFISFLPDNVGMGEGRGFQTYVHAETVETASMDFLNATTTWFSEQGIAANDQLFITGYSQGGYSAMAMHKHIEEDLSASLSVTAAAHLSGPYSLSGVMRDVILSDQEYLYPAYIPNTVLGFKEAYPDIYQNLDEIFKPEYIANIQAYYNGQITLITLNDRLYQALRSNTGQAVGKRMLKDEFVAELVADPNNRINQILKENDVYDWAPKAPTRIFYCKADDQVSYLNSVLANETMIANGAQNLITLDVNSNADHGACFNPAILQTAIFFLGLQQISVSTNEENIANNSHVFPNPVHDVLYLSKLPNYQSIKIYDTNGRLMMIQNTQTESIDISQFPSGVYQILVQSASENILTQRIVKI